VTRTIHITQAAMAVLFALLMLATIVARAGGLS
jgi:hypothetical protein